jgi:hypothetical protein
MTTTLLCMSLHELAAQVQAVFTDYEKKQNETRTLTALEVQEMVGVSAQMLWRWQCSGKLIPIDRKGLGRGTDRTYKYSSVVAFISARRAKSKKEVCNV